MRDGKRGSLLLEQERKFPDEHHGRIYKKRKSSVLKFAGQIAADPGIGTQEWPMAFAPAPRDIGKHGQDRQFIVVIPKNKWIVPEQEQTKCDDNCASSDCAEEISPLINTDFHRCRKRNLLVRVSSAFIRD